MAAKTVLNYLPRESVIHKMTGTTKLAFFLLFTFASMITYNTWVLLGLLVVSLLAFRLSRIKFREVRFMMTFMLVFLLLNNLFIFLFDPNQGTTLYGTRTVLCHLFWWYDLTAEQLFYMINISLKYFVALPVAILFISATDPSEFAASLNSIGISYKVGYSVAIALRYIPDIQRDYHSISQAQQARGVELGKKEPFFKRMKNSVNILLPLILTSLNRIDTISNAMELRGFGKNSKRTWYTQRPFARRDFIALGVGVVLLLTDSATRRQPAGLGALGAHLGMALAALGIAFSGPYTQDREMLLAKGQSEQVGGYTATLLDIKDGRQPGYDYIAARLQISKDGKDLGVIAPERRMYDKFGNMQFSEVDVIPGLGNEIYGSLLGLDEDLRVLVKVSVEPLVNWIWIGGTLMCLLPLLGLRRRASPVGKSEDGPDADGKA